MAFVGGQPHFQRKGSWKKICYSFLEDFINPTLLNKLLNERVKEMMYF
jgi:hypothetical protein